jgi:SAM-dependent methyltransferase
MQGMSLQEIIYRFRYALSIVEPGALAIGRFSCPICASRLLLRLARTEIGVRCLGCSASAITLSMVSTLVAERPGFRKDKVYELSSRGPLYLFLRRTVADLTFSEYFDDLPPGEWRGGIQCQDIHRLTYPDASFDLVTSTEVFEHVADDRRGFAEIRRVLRPGGAFVFTVPIENAERTVERAVSSGGGTRHLLPPAYHDDRIRGRNAVLVFRDYGRDITGRLLAAGFGSARIESRYAKAFLGAGRGVVVARP